MAFFDTFASALDFVKEREISDGSRFVVKQKSSSNFDTEYFPRTSDRLKVAATSKDAFQGDRQTPFLSIGTVQLHCHHGTKISKKVVESTMQHLSKLTDTSNSMMNHSMHDHSMIGMDHNQMDHSEMDHSQMDHSQMDHSQMDHSSMDHSNMNHTGMDMMDHGMKMYFHFSTHATILFKGWQSTDWQGMLGSCVAVFIMAALYEGLKVSREYLLRRSYYNVQYTNAVPTTEDTVIKDPQERTMRARMLSLAHIIQTVLHILQIVVSYFLMLIFMTYNVYLCIAVALGAGVGYFLFAWKRAIVIDVNEHCH